MNFEFRKLTWGHWGWKIKMLKPMFFLVGLFLRHAPDVLPRGPLSTTCTRCSSSWASFYDMHGKDA